MSFRNRTNDGNHLDQKSEFYKNVMIAPIGKKFRVYEDGSYYTQVTGGVVKRGKVLRGLNGVPVSFNSIKEAEQWIDGGMLLVKDGKDIDF